MANPVSSVTRPLSTSSLTFAPSSPRAGNWSASPPLKMRARSVLRVAHRSEVRGSVFASCASSSSALPAEWPDPTTSVFRPA